MEHSVFGEFIYRVGWLYLDFLIKVRACCCTDGGEIVTDSLSKNVPLLYENSRAYRTFFEEKSGKIVFLVVSYICKFVRHLEINYFLVGKNVSWSASNCCLTYLCAGQVWKYVHNYETTDGIMTLHFLCEVYAYKEQRGDFWCDWLVMMSSVFCGTMRLHVRFYGCMDRYVCV